MDKKPKILGLIPARGGSKGIPDKNIRFLAGKPLIHYTIESALQSEYLDTIAVSSDSEMILDSCKKFSKIEIPFIRPATFAADESPMIDVVQHALNHYKQSGRIYDYVCLLQPTSPFRNPGLIDRTISYVIQTGAESLITLRKVPHQYNPHWTFYIENNTLKTLNGEKTLITRRQDLPETWYRDGKIYVASTDLIREGKLIGETVVGFRNEDEPHVNIDSWEDWLLAEKILANEIQP